MKTICILKDGRPFWTEIEKYLKLVNAKIFNLELKNLSQSVEEKKPDIIIAGERSLREVLSITLPVPKLVIAEGNSSINTKAKDVSYLKWPASSEAFLEVTSRLLYVSDRRLFKTVITINNKNTKETFLGKSMNFSMTGMAFKVERELNQGDILNISFFVPGVDERMKIDVEVMRSSINPDDNSVYYGARFLDIDNKTRDALEGFIKKI